MAGPRRDQCCCLKKACHAFKLTIPIAKSEKRTLVRRKAPSNWVHKMKIMATATTVLMMNIVRAIGVFGFMNYVYRGDVESPNYRLRPNRLIVMCGLCPASASRSSSVLGLID
jgi:hypothetical protein